MINKYERWMVDYEHGEDEPQHAVLSWVTPDDEPTKELPEVGTYLVREIDMRVLDEEAQDFRNVLEAIQLDKNMPEHYMRRLILDALNRHIVVGAKQ